MKLSVSIRKKLSDFVLDADFVTNGTGTGILGASGSGKSMTLRCIAGIDTPDSGRIVLGDRVLFDSDKGIDLPVRERGIGMLFQHYALFPHMTAAENISFGMTRQSASDRARKVEELLSLVRLEEYGGRYPRELSGGQQQRIAVARALSVNPDAILFDEPFSALDDYMRGVMIREFIQILSVYRGALLFVTHNIDEAFRVCGSLVVLDNGTVKGKGETRSLFDRPPTIESARITGCKNITRINRLSDGGIDAVDWNCRLNCADKVNPAALYAGIRANHLRMSDEIYGDNIIPCHVTGTSESPFRMQLFLLPAGASPSDERAVMQWDIPKEKWEQIKSKPQPWGMFADPAKIFVM